MRKSKLIVFSALCFLFNVALGSTKVFAAPTSIGAQKGTQTRAMSIDEGLKILGYNPSDFQIKKKMAVDERTDLTEYYGRYYDREDNLTPFEVIGVTEGYEYLDSGYIDTYIYMYTPYLINRIDKEEYTSDSIMNPLITDMSLKMDVNKEYENIDSTYFNVRLNGYASGKFDDDLQNYAGYNRAYVYSSQETKSVSSGVTRILLRIYKASDLTNERKYRVEKVLYNYFNPANAKNQEGTTLPHINVKYKDKQVISSVDADTDSTTFVVKNKSVVMCEALTYMRHKDMTFGLQDKTNMFILLRNKVTNQYINDAKQIQILFRVGSEKQFRSAKQDVLAARTTFKFSNIYSKYGELSKVSEKHIKVFKDEIMPNLDKPYTFEEYPQYCWDWNYYINDDAAVAYVWYEVVAGTVIQGSCYENGLHVEYDDNGKALGVYDYKGDKVDVNYDPLSGVILNDDGTTRLPENSILKGTVTEKDLSSSLVDKIKNNIEGIMDAQKNIIKYILIAGGTIAGVFVVAAVIKGKKED